MVSFSNESLREHFCYVLFHGLRFDVASVCIAIALPLLVLIVSDLILKRCPKPVEWLIRLWLVLCLTIFVVFEGATPGFIKAYGVRPNALVVEYLSYPDKVFQTLVGGGYLVSFILNVIGLLLSLVLGWYVTGKLFAKRQSYTRFRTALSLLLVLLLVPFGVRSTIVERPLKPERLVFSSSLLANSMYMNSAYSVYHYTAFNNRDTFDRGKLWNPHVTEEQVIAAVAEQAPFTKRDSSQAQCPINQIITPLNYRPDLANSSAAVSPSGGSSTSYVADVATTVPVRTKDGSSTNATAAVMDSTTAAATDTVPSLSVAATYHDSSVALKGKAPRLNHPQGAPAPRNVVLVLEESLGAQFVGALGGYPISPYIDELKQSSWWFEQMHASGVRSRRGIEAVTAGMPASLMESFIQLAQKNPSYATLFEVYKELGYATTFVYAGESIFDNMRSYFLSNGMQDIIEKKDFSNPSFVGVWGVSDEELFAKAQEVMRQHEQENKPFFLIVYTTSFHEPFNIPAGKVSLGDLKVDKPEVLLAAKYADYALGKFIASERQKEHFKDTLYVVIADHESEAVTNDSETFPLFGYRITSFILNSGLPAQNDRRIVSQVDLVPTILSLTGVKGSMPFIGQDLTKPIKERALMQYVNNNIGYREDDKLVVFTPGIEPLFYQVTDQRNSINPIAKTPALAEMFTRASTLEHLGILMYQKQWNSKDCLDVSWATAPQPQQQN